MGVTQKEVNLAIAQARALVGREMKRQRLLLRDRVSAFEELNRVVLQARTDRELDEYLDAAGENRDRYDQMFVDGYDQFEEQLAELEGRLFELAGRRGRKAVVEAERETQPAASTSSEPREPNLGLKETSLRVEELLEFIDPYAGELPHVEECKQKLRQATALQKELQALWQKARSENASEVERKAVDEIFDQLAKLEMVFGELRPLIKAAKAWSSNSQTTVEPKARQQPRKSEPPVPAAEESPNPRADKSAALRRWEETLRRFEDDYHRHFEIWHILRKTAENEEHEREMQQLKVRLDLRREELSRWRTAEGWEGQEPELIADVFRGALPGESHVRGVTSRTSAERSARREHPSGGGGADVSAILRDFYRPRASLPVKSGGQNPNRRVFRTSGQVNPRAKRWP